MILKCELFLFFSGPKTKRRLRKNNGKRKKKQSIDYKKIFQEALRKRNKKGGSKKLRRS